MSNQKETWYVWTGKGEKPKGIKAFRGAVGVGMTIYTLGKTRERAECEICGGLGLRFPTFGADFLKCPDCQGRGYIWKQG